MGSAAASTLSLATKAWLTLRIWRWTRSVQARLRREPLPQLVADLGRRRSQRARRYSPAALSRAVDRRLGRRDDDPTCLVRSLVLYRLLSEQGDQAEVVIGLPADAVSQAAHAWVELDGRDVGPWPGRGAHVQLARYR